MRKIFAFALALCLLCGVTAFATEYGPGDDSAETKLQVTVGESYTIVIPATVDIDFEAKTTNLPVQVTALRTLSKGTAANTVRKLAVEMTTDNKLTNANGDNLAYTVDKDAVYFTAAGTQNFVIGITQANWNAAPAGTYTDTVTFAIAIGNY